MTMAKTKSVRTVKVSREDREKLAQLFGCTERAVFGALCFESSSELARKIRHVALSELGGWVEAAVPEEEIFYDTQEDGERLMRQYFANGAVLTVSLRTGEGVVTFKGEPRLHYAEVRLTNIPDIQELARSMK